MLFVKINDLCEMYLWSIMIKLYTSSESCSVISVFLLHNTRIDQFVEHLTINLRAAGSSPALGNGPPAHPVAK